MYKETSQTSIKQNTKIQNKSTKLSQSKLFTSHHHTKPGKNKKKTLHFLIDFKFF